MAIETLGFDEQIKCIQCEVYVENNTPYLHYQGLLHDYGDTISVIEIEKIKLDTEKIVYEAEEEEKKYSCFNTSKRLRIDFGQKDNTSISFNICDSQGVLFSIEIISDEKEIDEIRKRVNRNIE